ncbi:hypothetical protein ERJ75_000693700 [Trypanosoma vivax]|nr:hypothetical protein ERJ75_000693700 [Trypanosoma vivax]
MVRGAGRWRRERGSQGGPWKPARCARDERGKSLGHAAMLEAREPHESWRKRLAAHGRPKGGGVRGMAQRGQRATSEAATAKSGANWTSKRTEEVEMPAKRSSKLECGGPVVAERASVGPVRKRARQRSVVILREGRTFADQHGHRHRREMQPVGGREMWFARTKEQIRTRHFCSAQAASSGVSTSSATKLRRGRKGKEQAWRNTGGGTTGGAAGDTDG